MDMLFLGYHYFTIIKKVFTKTFINFSISKKLYILRALI